MANVSRLPEPHLKLLGLLRRDDRQRRSLFGPDLRIGVSRAFRTSPQNDSAQNRLPDGGGYFHHPLVREKLGKVAPDGARSRLVGRAEVDQQPPELERGDRTMIRRQLHSPPDSSGRRRRRSPVAENNALAMAGATGAMASSPGSNGSAALSINSTLISGLSASVGKLSEARRPCSGRPRSYSTPEPRARPTPKRSPPSICCKAMSRFTTRPISTAAASFSTRKIGR